MYLEVASGEPRAAQLCVRAIAPSYKLWVASPRAFFFSALRITLPAEEESAPPAAPHRACSSRYGTSSSDIAGGGAPRRSAKERECILSTSPGILTKETGKEHICKRD